MLAPITLFVYNRLNHTQQTIESLKKNEYAKESTLFIYSDGPKTDLNDDKKSNENKKIINNIRKYLKTIDGFKNIIIIEQKNNIGLANSIIKGVTEVVNKFGKVIVLEDDMVLSEYFLKYMNEALDIYENEERVISIHGYIYPVKGKLPATYFIKGADCWGWATWKRGWDLFNPDGQFLLKEIQRKKLEAEFNFKDSYDYLWMLKQQIDGKNNSWAIRWYASAFLNNKLTLYPGHSLVKNIGLDNSGTHCGENSNYDTDISDSQIFLKKIPIKENKKAKNKIIMYFNLCKGKKNILNEIFIKVSNKMKKILKKIFKKEINNPIIEEYGWFGIYENWEEAKNESSGYDSDIIINKVKKALLKVKNKKAAYERDSVIFDKIQYSFPILTGLLWIASLNKNKLNLIDFGGSLGSSYFQNIFFLKHLKHLRWNIVEQQKFFKLGIKYFQDDYLKFYQSIDECLLYNKVNAIIFSSVIQYIKEPFTLLTEIFKKNIEYIIFDLTGFINKENDIITLQKVPPEIYQASYPCWFFNEEKFIRFMNKKYDMIIDFNSYIGADLQINNVGNAKYRGFIFKIKKKFIK